MRRWKKCLGKKSLLFCFHPLTVHTKKQANKFDRNPLKDKVYQRIWINESNGIGLQVVFHRLTETLEFIR
jgi:hypothetical protein